MANYFRSEDVKVFPSAYRGQNINPEASSFTEYNFTNIYSKQSEKKESFIISYTKTKNESGDTLESKLKCVIGGYYFEINFINYEEHKSDYKYLAIKVENKDVKYITSEEKQIDEILNIFKKNEVTPISVEDVISDLLIF